MQILVAIVFLAFSAILASCEQRSSQSDADPGLGFACFDKHSASLPPGTQYEGVEKLAEGELTIKVMNGVDVVMLVCGLNPDGTVRDAGK